MAEDAARAAALRAYEEVLRAYEEQNGNNAEAIAAGDTDVGGSAYPEAEERDAARYGDYNVSMEDQARMMLMERLNSNSDGGSSSISAQEKQQQQLNNYLMQEWMGIPGASAADDGTAQQLLRIMEQQRQQNATFAAVEEAMQMRPEKHFLTISQDGRSMMVAFLARANSVHSLCVHLLSR